MTQEHIQEYILGVKIDFGITKDQVLERILKCIENGAHEIICTTNSEFIVDAQRDEVFKEIINNSYMSLPDSSGIMQAQKYLTEARKLRKDKLFPIKALILGLKVGIFSVLDKTYLDSTLSGSDLIYDICKFASENNLNIFILGGDYRFNRNYGNTDYRNTIEKKDMSQDVVKILSKMYPNLKIIGASSKFTASERDDENTVNYIHECMEEAGVDNIDILLVAYGHSKQEKWIERNKNKIPSSVSIGLGGTFDYVTNFMKRPSKLIINAHMEWFYRLINQPFRFKRILKAFPIFPLLVYTFSLNNN